MRQTSWYMIGGISVGTLKKPLQMMKSHVTAGLSVIGSLVWYQCNLYFGYTEIHSLFLITRG